MLTAIAILIDVLRHVCLSSWSSTTYAMLEFSHKTKFYKIEMNIHKYTNIYKVNARITSVLDFIFYNDRIKQYLSNWYE